MASKNPVSGIYIIRNWMNGNIYLGSSVDIEDRWRDHRETLRKGTHHSEHLQRAWSKHGEDSFVFEILITCDPIMLRWYEQQFLNEWKPEYNESKSAQGFLPGHKHSSSTKHKLSEARKRQAFSKEHYKKLGESFRGEGNPSNKLSEDDVLSICDRLDAGEHQRKLASIYNVTQAMISRINRGLAWNHLTHRMGGDMYS